MNKNNKDNESNKISNSAGQTKEIGAGLAKRLKGGEVVCLYGEMGAGKTTFVQGMAEGLGIKGRIISPTFVIARSYKIGNQIKDKRYEIKDRKRDKRKRRYLWHIDLYRLTSLKEAEAIGIREIMADKDSITVIEWPEKTESVLPRHRWAVRIDILGEEQRMIKVVEL